MASTSAKKRFDLIRLIVIVVTVELVGLLSTLITGSIKGVYMDIARPALSPPSWLFGVMWPILYLLMGIALYLVSMSTPSPSRRVSNIVFWVQLFVNFLWPIIFFKLKAYWIAAALIILLDLMVILTMILFCRRNKAAAYLLIPYLLWILFATYLNIGIALLN